MDKQVNENHKGLVKSDNIEKSTGLKEHEGLFDDSVDKNVSTNTRIIRNIMDMKEERRASLAENIMLQQQLSDLLEGILEQNFGQENEMTASIDKQAFSNLLNKIDARLEEMRKFEQNSSKVIDSLKKEISETETMYEELNEEFKSLKEKAALESINSNTGKTYSEKEVRELLWKEQKAEEKLQYYQLEYLRKKHDLQGVVEEKRNLVEGPVNYAEYDVMYTEIENNLEVTKQLEKETEELQKKMFSIINIISHLKQKLQFVQHQKGIAGAEAITLEEELRKMRNNLLTEKQQLQKMKNKNQDLRHKFIFLQYPELIEDYKVLKAENETSRKELQQLKDEYASLRRSVLEFQKKNAH